MDLNDFINESLTAILAGIRAAQAKEGGGKIVAELYASGLEEKNIIARGESGTFTFVEFDIAVSAGAEGKAGVGLKVASFGVEAGGARTSQATNRIKFSVPIKLPHGEAAPAAAGSGPHRSVPVY
jgi:hypothetical protein